MGLGGLVVVAGWALGTLVSPASRGGWALIALAVLGTGTLKDAMNASSTAIAAASAAGLAARASLVAEGSIRVAAQPPDTVAIAPTSNQTRQRTGLTRPAR